MKKNFISILILGCTIVNLIVSAITMFSVVTTNHQTAKIVKGVASVIDLELGTTDENANKTNVPIENIVTYSIPEQMTIGLKSDADGTPHYCMVTVFFSMDSKHEDFKKYGESVSGNELIFKSIVGDVIQQYTIDEARINQEEMQEEILRKVQEKYQGSDFIFEVSFSDIVFQ